jgi:hypothetical protein
VATDDLPISIAPGESQSVTVHVQFRGTPGVFQNQFVFDTDDERRNRTWVRFHGRVLDSPSK